MTIDPRTAPLDAIRDWFAKRDGWNKPGTPYPTTNNPESDAMSQRLVRGCWWKKAPDGWPITQYDHPYPPTLDGAAGAMPSGWYFWINYCALNGREVFVCKAVHKQICTLQAESEAADEITARYRLAALAAVAMDEKEAT